MLVLRNLLDVLSETMCGYQASGVFVVEGDECMDFVKKTGNLLKTGKSEFALNLCEQGIAEGGCAADLLNNEGVAYLQMKQYEAAEQALKKALEQKPEDEGILKNIGLVKQGIQNQEPDIQTAVIKGI